MFPFRRLHGLRKTLLTLSIVRLAKR